MADRARFAELDVVILEDEFVIALDLEDLFLGWGCRSVRVASTVEDCATMLDDEDANLLIADFNIGLETSERLIAERRRAQRPVILLTGQIIDQAMIDQMGDPVVIAKPIQPETLRDRIEGMLAEKAA